ncbi:hypothetical protein PBI_NESBITT_19 [Streptomyces phage Nesbitt]|uniref:Uncharacterized protein n=3 Tax=Caudoviricetes TaxID=2731619 RepID=A0A0K1Y583_9CAUD|nr:hypothetical protein AVV13_gp18 [Streptomyces phage SF1]YP_009796741.1 hypothetical protein HOS57_gp19 [Streptomyces phage AbbeyMikolon]AKY02167.1 hypothetical protein SF1_180 [Streptomyces phage SF1]AUG87091.1 hypothetical protein SEA_ABBEYMIKOLON_19 [Streptomyces phage AbbeyMikolon]AVO22276.1 hypothetical protein PBI_NESBITT_19 [Streptomyces phage Nesbitt]
MATSIDRLISAVIRAVRTSGVLEENTLSGTVSVVNTDGTVDVTRNGSTYPRVRRLSGYTAPAVGHTVTIHKTSAGWVCLGAYLTS